MSGAVFRHVGGAVVAEHGPIALAAARALIVFYGKEAAIAQNAGGRERARLYARRALALHEAIQSATLWRRAAGWRDPDAADQAWTSHGFRVASP